MAKPIEQVEQDLRQLKIASCELGRELTAAYRSYFTTLAPTLNRQSIQACYYLCTNYYPETFLKLNYDRRTQLLKTLQRVISNVIADLVVKIDPSRSINNDDEDEDEPTGELIANPATPIDWFATPISLSTWQQNLEEDLSSSLKEISYKVNLLLQQAEIMSPNIPKQFMEANPLVDRQGENTANIPNLLSVIVGHTRDREEEEDLEDDISDRSPIPFPDILQQQSGSLSAHERLRELVASALNQRDEIPELVQVHTLYLRLAEVEFADVMTLSLRKNINQLIGKVNTLRREYLQKQQELKIAEAESAWRNSWFEAPS